MKAEFALFMSKLKTIKGSLKPFQSSTDTQVSAQARKVEKEVRKLKSLVSANSKKT
jgi:archaellum component FlaC